MTSHRMTEGYTNLGTTFRIRRAQHRAKGEHIKSYKNPRESAVAVGIAVEKKVGWSIDKFFVLAFMAGCYVGVGGTAAASIASQIKDPAEAGIVFALFYPIGLFLVLFVGGELFTGNLMYYTFSLMQGNIKKSSAAFALIATFILNWAGCVASAYFFGVLTEIFDNRKSYLIHLAIQKVTPSWHALLLRGIPANFLACTSIFTFKSGEDIISKIFAIWVPAMTFLVADFEHCVTNMFLVSLGIFLGAPVSYGKFIYWNLIPVTIGNFIGGGLFVGGATFYLYSYGENPQQLIVSRKPKGFNYKKWSFLERRKYIREANESSDEEPDRGIFDFRPSLDTGYTYNIHDRTNNNNNNNNSNNNNNNNNNKRFRSDSDHLSTSTGAQTQDMGSGWDGELRYANRTVNDQGGMSRSRGSYPDRSATTRSHTDRSESVSSFDSPRRSRLSRDRDSRRSDSPRRSRMSRDRDSRGSFSRSRDSESPVEYYHNERYLDVTNTQRYSDARIPIEGESERGEMRRFGSDGEDEGSW